MQYYLDNKDKLLINNKYRKEYIREYNKNYYLNNKEKIIENRENRNL